jgi:hypothetical protein
MEGRKGAHKKFWCGHFRQRVLLEDLGVEGRAIIK